MDDSIETIIERSTHGVFLLYNIQNKTLSIVTKGGFNTAEVIELMDRGIASLTNKIVHDYNGVKET